MLEPWLFDRDTENAAEWAADSYPDISENSIPPNPTCCDDNDAGEPFASAGRGGAHAARQDGLWRGDCLLSVGPRMPCCPRPAMSPLCNEPSLQ